MRCCCRQGKGKQKPLETPLCWKASPDHVCCGFGQRGGWIRLYPSAGEGV